eukprot:380895-Pyramimonas_sp.AAC.1
MSSKKDCDMAGRARPKRCVAGHRLCFVFVLGRRYRNTGRATRTKTTRKTAFRSRPDGGV